MIHLTQRSLYKLPPIVACPQGAAYIRIVSQVADSEMLSLFGYKSYTRPETGLVVNMCTAAGYIVGRKIARAAQAMKMKAEV